MNQRELLKGNTPSLILAVLRDGPLHGYAIARQIEERSGKSLSCKEGTLYPALQSLEREGLITGSWETAPSGRSRRVYSLTPEGHAALEEGRRAWERFAAGVNRILIGGTDEPEAGVVNPGSPFPPPALDPTG